MIAKTASRRDKENGRQLVAALVDRFDKGIDFYKSSAFDETSAREQFINKLFQALGWDVLDDAGLGPDSAVRYHLRLTSGGQTAGDDDWDDDLLPEEIAQRLPRVAVPDYSFRHHGETQFFVEAKRPEVNLRGKAPNFQVKSYAWNQRVPVAVLTDFEELRVFLAVQRPDYHKPDFGLIDGLDLRFDEYIENWDRLWEVLSRESVEGGSIAQLAQQVRQRTRGALPVDESLVRQLSDWRAILATDLLTHNPTLDRYELSEATQRILDRVVFVRVCEDRNIEPSLVLRRYARIADAYRRTLGEFRRMDGTYNGQLFARHFSERLELSDEVFQRLIESLYVPYSSYRFDVIGPDVLGSIYERFLGKEIEIDPAGAAVLVDKPEVRHAGGVYYTPKWVVDQIVARILGPLLAGKTPRAAANLRIVDPACGSGSFLLGALDFLIDWHERYYDANPNETSDRHFPGADGRRRLTVDAKADILKNCLFGCDIDPQAVEVTQVSLYLRVLEQETQHSLQAQPRLFQAAYLPPLDRNIRCGNTLLAPQDIPSTLLQDAELARRINPFDWRDDRDGFGSVFATRGGFDAVIGNPPYTRTQELRRFRPDETNLYVERYASARTGSFDIAALFVERGLSLLREGRDAGRLGFIVSRQLAESDYGQPLRQILSSGNHVEEIVDFGAGTVFDDVGAYTMLLFLSAGRRRHYRLTRVPSPPSLPAVRSAAAAGSPLTATLTGSTLTDSPWDLMLPDEASLIERLQAAHPSLQSVAGNQIFQGVVTGADFVFCVEDLGPDLARPGLRRFRRRDDHGTEGQIETDLLRPVLAGRTDIQPFWQSAAHRMLLLPYERPDPSQPFVLIPPDQMRRRFPHAFDWLQRSEAELRQRAGNWDANNWFGYSRRQNLELFDQPKVLVPYMVERLCATHDTSNHYFVNVATGGYGMPVSVLANDADPAFLAALLSSNVLSWVLRRLSRAWRGDWFAARKGNLQRLPIVLPEPQRQQALVALYHDCARQQLVLRTARSDADVARARRLFNGLRNQFDEAVEDLYQLAPEERRIVRLQ